MKETQAINLCIEYRDPIGFEFLVQKYRKLSFYTAFSMLQNKEDAYDACQDAFEKAFKKILSLNHLDQFYPWFYVILKNICLNMLARQNVKQKHVNIITFQDGLKKEASAEQLIYENQEQQLVVQVLGQLKSEFEEILILKFFDDKSYQEIAAILKINKGTVMSRLYYAKKAFAKVFEESSNE